MERSPVRRDATTEQRRDATTNPSTPTRRVRISSASPTRSPVRLTTPPPDYRAVLPHKEVDSFENTMRGYAGLWCCNRPPGGRGAGHIWYDFLHDVVPHRDRFNRTMVKRVSHECGHRLKVKARVRAKGTRGTNWYGESRVAFLRKRCRTQMLWSIALAGALFLSARFPHLIVA